MFLLEKRKIEKVILLKYKELFVNEIEKWLLFIKEVDEIEKKIDLYI